MQVAASQGNGGNASVLAGISQWGAMFADMIAYPINTEGAGRPSHAGRHGRLRVPVVRIRPALPMWSRWRTNFRC